MMARRHGVNDSGRREPVVGNEIIRIPADSEGFIPSGRRRATASFLFLDRSGRVSM
jgi:hypothetical protein